MSTPSHESNLRPTCECDPLGEGLDHHPWCGLAPRSDPPGPAYTYGHRDAQVGMTDDGYPIEKCERCGRQRIGIYPEDPCPGEAK